MPAVHRNSQKADAQKAPEKRIAIRWPLLLIDVLCYTAFCLLFLWLYDGSFSDAAGFVRLTGAFALFISVYGFRIVFKVYRQVWRYAGMSSYLRLLLSDAIGLILYVSVRRLPLIPELSFGRTCVIAAGNLLTALAMRILYQYIYQSPNTAFPIPQMRALTTFIFGVRFEEKKESNSRKIRVAIIGAGRIGVSLADELLQNARSAYTPVCFVERNLSKVGRSIMNIPVYAEDDSTAAVLGKLNVQQVIVALPSLDLEHRNDLYKFYTEAGYQVKLYDFPTMQEADSNGRRTLREFGIEELLFRKVKNVMSVEAISYYTRKTILVTGGGGSIGSELCRQIARMRPRRLIVVDNYENGAYALQQDLRHRYGKDLDLAVEIISVCDRRELAKVFVKHHPDIVIHAAAHKHVPLMERNVCEAVRNNVFGTKNVLEIAEASGCSRFIMVSTDKAVNPTNIMGATKRMCEMMVLGHTGNMLTSATRFGNVLGSAGSVVPLFKKQIAAGGPITLTDKRIVRYFMTIPEAAQLVLESGAIARQGDLFVLDMGKPVRILELAENMIRLSGLEPYKDIDIQEIGLREGEKLYEELLIKSEDLSATSNELIFIEHDEKLEPAVIREKLAELKAAVEIADDEAARRALRRVVPTFKTPEEVNQEAAKADEMKEAG